jgi:dipeptidase E
MNLLLLSNSRKPGGGWLDHAEPLIRELLGSGRRRVLFLPFAAIGMSFDAYTAMAAQRLARMGCIVRGAHRIARRTPADFDAVVVGGGNTFRLLAETRARGWLAPLRRAVRTGLPYLGWSAGANLACPSIRTTNDMPVVDPGGFAALDLVPFQINAHYTERSLRGHGGETRDQRIAEFLAMNPGVPVLGLREGSLVHVEPAGTTGARRGKAHRATLLLGPGARLFRHKRPVRDLAAGTDLSALLG